MPIIAINLPCYILWVASAILLPLTAMLFLATKPLLPLTLSDYSSYNCNTGTNSAAPVFSVLSIASNHAIALAEQLCHSPSIQEKYSAVNIIWRPRRFLSAEDLLNEEYDLLWNRQHVVLGLVPELFDYYLALVETPAYSLYWISRDSPVVLSHSYFNNKVVGLSQDQQSQTFYLQPMNALKHAGIELKAPQKKFFFNGDDILNAFKRGDVDVISGPLSMTEQFHSIPYFKQLINDHVPSGTWLLRRQLQDTQLQCEIRLALEVFAPMFEQLTSQAVAFQPCA